MLKGRQKQTPKQTHNECAKSTKNTNREGQTLLNIHVVNNLSVGWDLIPYPILHQFFENVSVLCFPDVVWKVVENFCTTVSETSTFSS